MDSLKMMTPNKAEENYKKLSEMFPNAITETIDDNGNIVRAIDKDILMQEISESVVDGTQERYQFTWPDKRKAIVLANTPISKTLRLNREKSYGKDGTPGSIDSSNIYIEGDNLDALKLLQETYLGKIKLIYIDPPYNTGSDLIYNDSFVLSSDEYIENSGQLDSHGNVIIQNTEGNGRFHTDWLNMIYPRIRLAKDLLSEDGYILISIGSYELDNVLKICDELFGRDNRAGVCSRQMKTGNNQGKYFTQNIDYIVVYVKNDTVAQPLKDDMNEELEEKVYNKVQEYGPKKGKKYRTMGLFQASLKHGGSTYPIECPDGSKCITPNGLPWRWNEKTFLENKENDEVIFLETNTSPLIDYDTGEKSKWNIYTKIWLDDRKDAGQLPSDLILKHENRHAAKELLKLNVPFDFPKPSSLIKYLLHLITDNDYYVMDFFSGSATTADAVMQINMDDGGKRKFILVQLPEEINYQDNERVYNTICDIGETRICRAGKRIKEENPLTSNDLDIGFRCFYIDSSNMKDVYYKPSDTKQVSLDELADNIKEDRSSEDLLIQVMLDLGILLSSEIEVIELSGKKVYSVADGYLYACFENSINDSLVTDIAKRTPYYAVFRDSGYANDSVAANFEQIFETYSPNTIRKVL